MAWNSSACWQRQLEPLPLPLPLMIASKELRPPQLVERLNLRLKPEEEQLEVEEVAAVGQEYWSGKQAEQW